MFVILQKMKLLLHLICKVDTVSGFLAVCILSYGQINGYYPIERESLGLRGNEMQLSINVILYQLFCNIWL